MEPTEFMFISKPKAQAAARQALDLGLGARVQVEHHQYLDEQGYIVRLWGWDGRELGALHIEGLVAQSLPEAA